ncbi:MAG: OmpA family protein [candidate division WOR-3 bacterium]|nr:MAG: OmpA family protein [candidate division WOR-3 bacterium]
MKKLLIICSLCTLPLFADFNRTSGLIDIPTANIMPHLGFRIGVDGSLGLQDFGEDTDWNVHMSMGLFDIAEAYIDVYTVENFTAAMGFCHRFLEMNKFSFAWGIHTISYDLDISEVGRGDTVGWFDDMMYNEAEYEKPFELGSAFLVTTYAITEDIDATLGIARGRYVGYGDQSKYFNSNFYHEQGGDWGVGLVAGIEAKIGDQFRFMIDGDGRDVNIGLGYRFAPLEFSVALSKLEWLIFTDDEYKPRLSASLSYVNEFGEKKPGAIAGKVVDEYGNPMSAEVGIVDDSTARVETNPGAGIFSFSPLDVGTYEVYAYASGYQTVWRKIKVRSGKTAYHEFDMQPEPVPPGNVHGKVVEAETDRPLIVDITVLETEYKTKSDSLGVFDVRDLPPGIYKIQAEAIGFETGVYPISIIPGSKNVLEIRMLKPYDVIVLYGINFEYNKAVILPESYPVIDEAAAIVMNHPNIRVEIQGHTDAIGAPEYNLGLSYMRANAVRDYLVEVHEISSERLVPVGYGEDRPVASNTTEEGRAKNRRVEFFILK